MLPIRLLALLGLAGLSARLVAQQRAPAARPSPRISPVLVTDPGRGRLVLFGGISDSGTFLNDTWELSAAGWERRHTEEMPSPRAYSAAAFDPTIRQVILFGGGTFVENADDTWGWARGKWSQMVSPSGPEQRWGAVMAGDTERRRLAMFGGSNEDPRNDMWEWDGAAWIKVIPDGPSPSGREYAALAYDEARHRAVLFGGDSADKKFGDTWEWDGRGWQERTLPVSPLPRNWPAMAYDPRRRVIVLFGGLKIGGWYQGDTWEWNGERWSRLSLKGPSPRYGHAMAYDPGRRQVVLFGGEDSLGMTDDTWLWNGSRWTQLGRTSPRDSATESRLRAMFGIRRDLAILMGTEREYFKDHGHYTSDLDSLPDYQRSRRVSLRFIAATDSGWSAESSSIPASSLVCAVFVGKAPPPIDDVKQENQVSCHH